MNGNNIGSASKKRLYRTIKVAPTTRAIRAALAVSATVVALSGSGAALAGTCAVTGTNEVTCNGVFTDDVTNTVPVIDLVPDLTLIVGTDGATTVDPAAGSNGITSTWGGDATVTSYADINVADAAGIYMSTTDGTGTVNNNGSIYALADAANAYGIDFYSSGDGTVTNTGDITASGATGTAFNGIGINASSDSDLTVSNSADGSVFGTSYDGTGVGISAVALGDVTVTNDGYVGASSFTGEGIGIFAGSEDGTTTVNNAGTIQAYSLTGSSMGVFVETFGDGVVNNTGAIYVGGPASAGFGVFDISIDGSATVDNSGTIAVTSYNTSAEGVFAYGKYADVTNSGLIDVAGYSNGVGILANGVNDATITNSGTINVDVYGLGADAAGISANGNGSITVTNSGDINVTSFGDGSGPTTLLPYSGGADGVGMSAVSYAESGGAPTLLAGPSDVNEVNTGDIYVNVAGNGMGIYGATHGAGNVYVSNEGTDTVYAGGTAIGAKAYSDAGYVQVYNSGTITVYGNDYGAGLYAYTLAADGNITVDNSGVISAGAHNDKAAALFAASYGYGADISVTNSGTASAYSYDDTAYGVHAYAGGDTADIAVTNSGSLSATSLNGSATGVYAWAYYSNVDVTNSGTISVSGTYTSSGIYAYSYGDGNVTVDSSGSIDVTTGAGTGSDAYGIYAYAYGDGDVTVTNSGTITVNSQYEANGIYAYANGDGNITVTNSGDISVKSYGDDAYGIYTYTNGEGDNTMTNSGTITVSAYGVDTYAYGIRGNTDGYTGGIMTATNSGSISVYSEYGGAYGIYVDANGDGADIIVDNSGVIDVNGYEDAYGIYTDMDDYAATTITNSGTINVYGVYYATGISAQTEASVDGSPITIDNSGDIYVEAFNGDAVGIRAYAGGYSGTLGSNGNLTTINVTNSGLVDVQSTYGDATGIDAQNGGEDSTILVDNSGTIQVRGYYGTATGINAVANGIYNEYATTVDNTGSMDVYASGASTANSVGINVSGNYAYANQGGDVYAHAYGYDGGYATGVLVSGYYVASFSSDGGSTSAYAGSYYNAVAEGVHVSSPNFAGFYNLGDISASAVSTGASVDFSIASATGASVAGTDVYFYNGGNISADATGYNATATGADVDSVDGLTNDTVGATYYAVVNAGTISATASGVSAVATGLAATSATGGIAVYNSGDITASGDSYSYGIDLNPYAGGGYGAYVYNSGLISATGSAYGNVAIDARDTAYVTIYNYGTITGAIWGTNADDYLYNGVGGVWNAGDTTSKFYGGDDRIYNSGTINLDNSTIDMGTYSVDGNYFYNSYYGTIHVNGDSVINMGGPLALVPSLNPLPLYNYGVIDFTDGDTDDYLTIIGDLAGQGYVNLDVSGLHGTSDHLYVDGSVVTGTVQTINVDLLDLPNSIATVIPMVYVSGDSTADNFALGDVTWDEDNSFVTLDFSLIADIDDTNVDRDVFSLGIEVTGLSDVGTLAASIPGAVQSLANSSVGTWRQRMGVIDSFNKGAISLWARVWQDKGSWDVDHHADNFGQGGNFNWDQKNSGIEGGIDFAVTDEFSLGLLVGKSKADTDLDDPGAGHSDIDADTWGIYGTWISPTGFYLDASYRWMSFDVDLHSVAGKMSFDDNAEVFNVELGYAWTLASGLKIEPQFQYTKTNLDDFDPLVTSTGMVFTNQGGESTHLRLGVSFRKDFGEAEAGWLWTPYLAISAVRENDGENLYAINNVFTGETDIGGTSTLLELGFNARHQNWAIYGGLNWQDGGAVNSFFGGQLGVRYTFGGPAPVVAPPPPPPQKTCADLDDDGDGVNNCDDKCLGSTAGQAVGPDGCPVPPPEEPAPAPKPFRG